MFGLSPQEWGEVAKIGGPIVSPLVAAVIALWQVRKLRKQQAEQNRKEQVRETLKIDARLAAYTRERSRVEKAFPPSRWQTAVPAAEVVEACAKDAGSNGEPGLEECINVMLTQFEIMALPVCSRTADEDMAFELIGPSMVWYATAFRDYVLERNKRENREDIYIYLLYLANRWKRRLQGGYKQLYRLPGN
jgi:hypothetical protein